MFALYVKSYYFNAPRSFNFIFSQENLPFSPKVSTELRSKLCSCNNKASRLQRDWFTFWWASVSYMHCASAASTQNGGCFEIRVFFVKVPLQRYRIYFHISEKLLMTQNNLERDQNCKGKKSVTQKRKYLSYLLKFIMKFKKSVAKVISRFFPFGWELLITNACSGLADCNNITNNYVYFPFVASDLLWLLIIFCS